MTQLRTYGQNLNQVFQSGGGMLSLPVSSPPNRTVVVLVINVEVFR